MFSLLAAKSRTVVESVVKLRHANMLVAFVCCINCLQLF